MKLDHFLSTHEAVRHRIHAWAEAQELANDYAAYPQFLVEGNTKTGVLGKYGLLFRTKGVPVVDCFGATDVCKRVCYALVSDTLWNIDKNTPGHTMPWVYSWLAHNDPVQLYLALTFQLEKLVNRYASVPLIIRIHEAGDLVSAAHLLAYIRLAQAFPAVTFFGYTRSFVQPEVLETYRTHRADTPNLSLRQSTDDDRPESVDESIPAAFFGHVANQPKKRFVCAEQLTRHTDNHLKCVDCGLCWTQPKVDVVFMEHRQLAARNRGKKKEVKKWATLTIGRR